MNWNYRVLSVSISSLHLSVSISISFYLDTILDTDKPDSQLATYCTFSVTLGPGPLGVTYVKRHVSWNTVNLVYLQSLSELCTLTVKTPILVMEFWAITFQSACC